MYCLKTTCIYCASLWNLTANEIHKIGFNKSIAKANKLYADTKILTHAPSFRQRHTNMCSSCDQSMTGLLKESVFAAANFVELSRISWKFNPPCWWSTGLRLIVSSKLKIGQLHRLKRRLITFFLKNIPEKDFLVSLYNITVVRLSDAAVVFTQDNVPLK